MIKKIKGKFFIGKKNQKEKIFIDSKIYRLLIGLVNILILSFLLLPSFSTRQSNIQIGDISTWDIRATCDFPVIDEELTEKHKKMEAESIKPIFDINLEIIEKTSKKIIMFFNDIKNIRKNYPAKLHNQENISINNLEKKKRDLIYKELEKIKNNYYLASPIEVLAALLEYAYKNDEYETFHAIEKNTILMVKEAMVKGVLLNKNLFVLGLEWKNKIEIYYPDRQKTVIVDISEVFDENEVLQAIRNDVMQIYPDQQIANIVYELSIAFVKPNLSYNIDKTKAKKMAAIGSVGYIYTIIKKGELIAREGERISEAQYKKYMALLNYRKKISFTTIISRTLIIFIFMTISYFYLSRQYPKIFYDNSKLILISFIFTSSLILQKIISLLNISPYLIPIAFSSILFSVLISPRISFFFTGIIAFMVGLVMDDNMVSSLIFFTAGAAGIVSMTRIRERISFTKAAIYISAISALTIFSLSLYEIIHISIDKLLDAFLWGGVNGLAATSLAGIFLPFIESRFKITTDIKLLELSDLNHPLLKKLSIEAPGSYHHSILVGNMAESAANAIGANALLSRVSSYYHDIGKMTKPQYFIENQPESKHDNLSSTLSTLIVTSHIKDGVELAIKYKLPQSIIDIIKQHHGTSLVQYFYQKALASEDEDKTGEVIESEYRYDGPKPQTKEAAIVMLADSIEAASRVLKEYNISRVKILVKKIIDTKLADGQFEECDITLNDLKKIADLFEKTVISIFHSRIDYIKEVN